jgi:DNA-binding transcriptional ArsR family regulator
VSQKPKFTRIMKVQDLAYAGVPTEAIPTYCALSDYANNKTGLCWPKMETLANTLGRSVRTVQRHLHLLKELGLIEFVERRRYKGKFSSYLYRILFFTTTGHGSRMADQRLYKKRTRQLKNTPKSPNESVKDGYSWLFGEQEQTREQLVLEEEAQIQRVEAAKRRTDGFEWLFG